MQSAPPLRPLVGVLYKRRDYVKTYCPRMFVLDGDLLHYYYTKEDSEPKATFCVSGCVIDRTTSGDCCEAAAAASASGGRQTLVPRKVH